MFDPKWPTPVDLSVVRRSNQQGWVTLGRRHSMANYCRMVRDTAMVTMESLNQHRSFEARSTTAYSLPFSQNGGSKCTDREMPSFEWPYLRNRWSNPFHVWFYTLGFSGVADRMALFPFRSNPTWQPAAILKISNAHISATDYPIHFTFGSSVGFFRSTDRMTLFRLRWNPRWWPWHDTTWQKISKRAERCRLLPNNFGPC